MKISFSAREKYLECPRKYKYHYIDRLRPNKVYSALFFGSALDDAFSSLLLQKKKSLSAPEAALLALGPQKAFELKMHTVELNKSPLLLAKTSLAEYYKSDFDESLITKKDLSHFSKEFPELNGSFLQFVEKCNSRISAKQKLLSEDQIIYNYLHWYSLSKKGQLMIKAYERDILPQIEEVFEVQKNISIKSNCGDEITGLIDFTASFKVEPGQKYICDNKTSSKKYVESSVRDSDQLATYGEAEQINKAAYAVVEKKLYKKEPIIHTQLIKDTISTEKFDKVLDSFAEVVDNVEAGKFPKNENACFSFGKLCPYAGICKYGKSLEETDLVVV